MAKWYAINARKDAIDVSIFTDIGFGYTAMDFQRDLQAAGDSKPINLRLNSPGGDVFTGWAIFNILNRMRDRVTVTVEGLAASMASVIAMAGKTIIMPENSMMMIHDPVGGAFGGPEEIASFAEALNKTRDQIVKTYSDRTGQPEDKIRSMMGAETWLSASEAVKLGFADKIEKPIQMAARAGFDLRCFNNVPSSFGTQTQHNGEVEMNEEIKRICALFGKADLAAGFIEAKKSVADVLTALEAAKAEDDKKANDAAAAAAAATAAASAAQPNADAIRQQVLDEVAEINSLCALAGKPALAAGFVKEKKSVKDVIAALAEAKAADANGNGKGKRASAHADTEVSARHNPRQQGESNAMELDPLKVWDKYNAAGKK